MLLQVQACELAHAQQSAVQHPLLDRVRQCSAKPGQAAMFFQHILSPVPHEREKVLKDPWCLDTVDRMQRDMGVGNAGVKLSCGLRAAMCRCWNRANPMSEAAVPEPPHSEAAPCKRWQRYLPFKSRSSRKASELVIADSGSHDHAEVPTGEARSVETDAAASSIRKRWKTIVGMFTGRSNSTSQHVDQAVAPTVALKAAELGDSIPPIGVSSGQQSANSKQPAHTDALHARPVSIAVVSDGTPSDRVHQAQVANSPMSKLHSSVGPTSQVECGHQHAAAQAQSGRLPTTEQVEIPSGLHGSSDAVRYFCAIIAAVKLLHLQCGR